jgi:hypothetical protein
MSAGPKPRALSHLDVAQVQRDRLFSSVKPYDDSAGPAFFRMVPESLFNFNFGQRAFPRTERQARRPSITSTSR